MHTCAQGLLGTRSWDREKSPELAAVREGGSNVGRYFFTTRNPRELTEMAPEKMTADPSETPHKSSGASRLRNPEKSRGRLLHGAEFLILYACSLIRASVSIGVVGERFP
jgi:hypothetical protein